eukprot:408429-Prorocentrum_minimum.AAC.2
MDTIRVSWHRCVVQYMRGTNIQNAGVPNVVNTQDSQDGKGAAKGLRLLRGKRDVRETAISHEKAAGLVALNALTVALNVLDVALNVLTVALNVLTVALNVLDVALNVLTLALNVLTVALNVLTVALNVLTALARLRSLQRSSVA